MSDNEKKILIDPLIIDEPKNKKPNKALSQPMIFDEITKSAEDKIYIVLLSSADNELFDGNYKICTGRTNCYRYIQELVESYGNEIDVHESIVITETMQTETDTGSHRYYLMNLNDCASIYSFCKSIEGYYTDDKFEIDNFFSPPTGERTNNLSSKQDVYAHTLSIEDPIIAKAAIDTLKEKEEYMRSLLSFPSKVEDMIKQTGDEPYGFTLDDDPMNV